MKSISSASLSVVLLLLPSALFGQPVTSTQLAERALVLLNSSPWLDKAWGVYLAGRLRRDDLRQHLIEQFRFATSLRDASLSIGEGVQPRGQTERLFHGETQIRYTTAGDFKRTIERSMDAQEQGIRAFLQTIEKTGLSARALHLKIEPQVEDKRRNSGDRLPTPAPREIDLR